jgi:hypothetical protein
MLVKCAGCSKRWHSVGYAAQVCGSTLKPCRYVERRDGQAQETCVSISRGNTTQTGSMRVAGDTRVAGYSRSLSLDHTQQTEVVVDRHRTAKHGSLMQVGG